MAHRTPPALLRHQRRRLRQVRDLALCTDDSLAAAVRATGDGICRETVTKYRSGDRCASLGLLDVILNHVDDPAAVLQLWAREHGLRVVPGGDLEADERGLTDRALQIAGVVGELMGQVRETLEDGQVTAAEREGLRFTVARACRELAELGALLEERAA